MKPRSSKQARYSCERSIAIGKPCTMPDVLRKRSIKDPGEKQPQRQQQQRPQQMNHRQAAVCEVTGIPAAKRHHQKDESGTIIYDMNSTTKVTCEQEFHQQVDTLPMTDIGVIPKKFSLIAPLRVPLDIGADEIYSMCEKRTENSQNFKPIFEEETLPLKTANMTCISPDRQVEPSYSSGIRPTPLIVVDNRNEAQLVNLQTYLQSPSCSIAVVRGLTHQLRMDLSLYSTKSLLELIPDQSIEIRTQYELTTDQNVNAAGQPTWEFYSQPGSCSLREYATYQAQVQLDGEKLQNAQNTEQSSAKKKRSEDLPVKTIKFGTNIDLSDSSVFGKQLQELQKLPSFCRPGAASDMLSHLGYTILGMNSVQMYMKVPHARTPAHVENNCLASLNINIGPGDCEWFAVPYEHWSRMNKMCKERKVDFLSGSWWPDIDELIREGIPVYRFTQKSGDLVWVGPGCIHWVQATGCCANISWNIGSLTNHQLCVALRSYEWNKLMNYRSLVPMQHLCWQIAKNVKFTNPSVYSTVKAVLIRSLAYCKMVAKYAESVGKSIEYQSRESGDFAPYCITCDEEVFNVLHVRKEKRLYEVYCAPCAHKRRFKEDKKFLVIQETTFPELTQIFLQCRLYGEKEEQLPS